MEHVKNILVTGCSSGIGYAIATSLANEGHLVYATARQQADIERLNVIPNIQGLELDVRNSDHLTSIVSFVERKGGLDAVVNNAGITDRGALMDKSHEELNEVLQINLLGPHSLIRQLFPLLMSSKGRIINISSLSGLVVPSFRGGYNLSKWGLIVYSEQLAQELANTGVKVSVISPGIVSTTIFDKLERIYRDQIDRSDLFKADLRQSWENMKPWIAAHQKHPDRVVSRVMEALTDEEPLMHYIVADEVEERFMVQYLIRRLVTIIQGFPGSWSREELSAILSSSDQNTK